MSEVSPIDRCLASETSLVTTSIRRRLFGTTPDGEPVDLFVLGEPGGVEASIMTYGAALQALLAPDRDAHLADVCLGFGTLAGYAENTGHYFGATVPVARSSAAGHNFRRPGSAPTGRPSDFRPRPPAWSTYGAKRGQPVATARKTQLPQDGSN
jgi:hypothetical protein